MRFRAIDGHSPQRIQGARRGNRPMGDTELGFGPARPDEGVALTELALRRRR
jgi:hypothetical protein